MFIKEIKKKHFMIGRNELITRRYKLIISVLIEKNYSNRIAFTGEIFEIINEGIKSIIKHSRKVPAFKIRI